MPRVLSQSGNVIAADFRPRASIDIQVKSEVLYCDRLVCLMRFSLLCNGELLSTEHITAQMPQV
jgi:hypothetical protein